MKRRIRTKRIPLSMDTAMKQGLYQPSASDIRAKEQGNQVTIFCKADDLFRLNNRRIK